MATQNSLLEMYYLSACSLHQARQTLRENRDLSHRNQSSHCLHDLLACLDLWRQLHHQKVPNVHCQKHRYVSHSWNSGQNQAISQHSNVI